MDGVRGRGACYQPTRETFIQMLGVMETAFPNVEDVDVEVWHIVCPGHTGTWSREIGLQKDSYGWSGLDCSSGCPQMIGEALEAALLRRRND
jgi:hypothetical protein